MIPTLWHTGIVRRRASIKSPEAGADSGAIIAFPTPVRAKNPAAVALGKLGGSKGGRKRAENLSPERRKSIAQQAAQARWAKERISEEVEASASHREGSS